MLHAEGHNASDTAHGKQYDIDKGSLNRSGNARKCWHAGGLLPRCSHILP